MRTWRRWAAAMLAMTFFYATAIPGTLLQTLLPTPRAVAAPETTQTGSASGEAPAPSPPTVQEVAETVARPEIKPKPAPAPQPPAAEEPAEAPAPEPPPTVRVMTFNMRHALGLDGQVSLERVAEAIAQADIVFVNEVDRFWLRSGLRDQPAVLQELTGHPYAHFGPALDLPGPSRQYGNLLLSRYPIVRAETVALPQPQGAEARVMVEAQIDVDGQIWTVYGVHLGLDPHERRLQVEAIQARAGAGGRARILLGDFNALPDASEFEPLWAPDRPRWVDGLAEGPATYPAWEPSARIDHIFLSPALAVRQLDAGVDDCQASDHLPAWVDLALPASPR